MTMFYKSHYPRQLPADGCTLGIVVMISPRLSGLPSGFGLQWQGNSACISPLPRFTLRVWAAVAEYFVAVAMAEFTLRCSVDCYTRARRLTAQRMLVYMKLNEAAAPGAQQ